MSELKPTSYQLVKPNLGVRVVWDSEFNTWVAGVEVSSDWEASATSALGVLAKKLRDIAASIEESL